VDKGENGFDRICVVRCLGIASHSIHTRSAHNYKGYMGV